MPSFSSPFRSLKMRLPPTLVTANFVLAVAAILAAIFALGLWLFVLATKERSGQMQVTTASSATEKHREKFEQFFITDRVPNEEEEGKEPPKQHQHKHNNQQIMRVEDGPPIQLDQLGMVPMSGGRGQAVREAQEQKETEPKPQDGNRQPQSANGTAAVDEQEPAARLRLSKPLCNNGNAIDDGQQQHSTMC